MGRTPKGEQGQPHEVPQHQAWGHQEDQESCHLQEHIDDALPGFSLTFLRERF